MILIISASLSFLFSQKFGYFVFKQPSTRSLYLYVYSCINSQAAAPLPGNKEKLDYYNQGMSYMTLITINLFHIVTKEYRFNLFFNLLIDTAVFLYRLIRCRYNQTHYSPETEIYFILVTISPKSRKVLWHFKEVKYAFPKN